MSTFDNMVFVNDLTQNIRRNGGMQRSDYQYSADVAFITKKPAKVTKGPFWTRIFSSKRRKPQNNKK